MRIPVVGGGVMGVGAAITLADLGAEVPLVAESLTRTLSRTVNMGLIEPFSSPDSRNDLRLQMTYRAYMMMRAHNPSLGIKTRPGILMSATPLGIQPSWSEHALAFRPGHWSPDGRFPYAAWYKTLTIRPDRVMDALQTIAFRKQVSYEASTVHDLESFVKKMGADALVVTAGLGMSSLWPDPETMAGIGLVRTVDVPVHGHASWIDSILTFNGVDIRGTVVMNADVPAYSIPQESDRAGYVTLGVGGTNQEAEPGLPIENDAELKREFRRNVAVGLPVAFTEIIDRLPGHWRFGARPNRNTVLVETKEIAGVPALGLGGAGGSGMSIWAGLVGEGIQKLLDAIGSSYLLSMDEIWEESLT